MCESRRAALAVAFLGLLQAALPLPSCDQTFAYQRGPDKQFYGRLQFYNDLSGVYDLKVEIAIPESTDEKITIVRETPDDYVENGETIVYNFTFPSNHTTLETIPTITLVKFNKNEYCKSTPAGGAFTLSARDIFGKVKRANIECGIKNEIQTPQLTSYGYQAQEGQYPWLVALFYYEGDVCKYRCAGTLISDRHVITAAHCVRGPNGNLEEDKLFAAFGRHNINNWAVNSVLRTAKKITVHPNFVKQADADVAVIIIDAPVPLGDLIRPVCLWDEPITSPEVISEKGELTGWSTDETGVYYIEEVKRIYIPVVKQETCEKDKTSLEITTSNRTFCAGESDVKIPCTGDSGGGFVMKRGGRWKLKGVSSATLGVSNKGLCDAGNYAVFADVSKHGEWIASALQED